MPKLTNTGYEIGSSDGPVIVLHKNKYGDTRQKKLDDFRKVRAGVELLSSTHLNQRALRRGTHLEIGVASWAKEELEILTATTVEMFEPTEAYRKPKLKIASSVDRIITVKNPLILENFSFEGEGICEIKTDFYHQNKPHPEWLIQVHHQMICTGHKWAVIACLDQNGKLNFYPVSYSADLADAMLSSYRDFWELVENGKDYPQILEAQDNDEPVDISELLPQTNTDLAQLCGDYLLANSETRSWKKTQDECKDAIIQCLDALNVDHAKLPGFVIKSQSVTKPKREMVSTGEFYETVSFSVKEASNE